MEQNWALARKQDALMKRARVIQSIRAFFVERDFLEVETPHRIPANAPEFHIDAEGSGAWFLRTSPELCLKRLLAAGYPRLFEMGRCWRQGERGSRHLPEYTMLEWYRAGVDYHALMQDCEALVRALCPSGMLHWQGSTLDVRGPWEHLSVEDAFERYGSVNLDEALQNGRFDEIIALEIEPRLGQQRPCILMEYPAEMAALSRRKPGQPEVAERFEVYILGMELANAFSELTDVKEQRLRFEKDEAQRRAAGKAPYPVPEKFLSDLPAMPDAAGIALGVDRLVMLLADARSIDEVTAFIPEDL